MQLFDNVLFESGLENKFNDWDGTVQLNGAYVQTGTQGDEFPVHHGTFSMKSASPAVAGSQSWAYKAFEHVTEVYVRLYVYFPEFWTYPNAWASGNPAWWLYFMILAPDYPIPRSRTNHFVFQQARVMYFTADQAGKEGWYFQGTYYDAGARDRAYLSNPSHLNQWALNPNQWYCVEWYNKLASAYGANDGVWRLWVDGQLYYNFTNLNNRDQDYPWFGAIMIGNYEVPPSTNGWDEPYPTVYMDCLKISTEYIGPELGPEPQWSLTIDSSPISGVSITVDDSPVGNTPTSLTVTEGTYTITVPSEVREYRFIRWEDGSTSSTRPVTITADTTITAYYEEVVPTPPTHVLNVNSYPVTSVSFTLDGTSFVTPFSTTLDEGTYTVAMQLTITFEGTAYDFVRWEDGSTNPIRTINLTSNMTLMAHYEVAASSPPPPPPPPPANRWQMTWNWRDLDNNDVSALITWKLYNSSQELSYTQGQYTLLDGTYTLKTFLHGELINQKPLETMSYGNKTTTIRLQMKPHASVSGGYIAFNNAISSITIHSETPKNLTFTVSGSGAYKIIIKVPQKASYILKDGVEQTGWTFDVDNKIIKISTSSLSTWTIIFTRQEPTPSIWDKIYSMSPLVAVVIVAAIAVILWALKR